MSFQLARRHYLAVFVLSFSLLMLEIVVARVLSVALYSHFAFVAVSLAMFGLGLSGLAVFLLPRFYSAERLDRHLITHASLFALSSLLSVLVFLRLQVVQQLSMLGFASLSAAYLVLAVPFFFGGVCVSLVMAHGAARIGRVYFADLAGAGLGCLGVVLAMETMPAPSVVLPIAVLAAGAALAVGLALRPRRATVPALVLLAIGAIGTTAVRGDLFRMQYVKFFTDYYADYEAWNAFSRVSAAASTQNAAQRLPLKNPADFYQGTQYPATMTLDIDGTAWTPMMNFDGDFSKIGFLRESALYIAHYLRHPGNVLIIGPGGGRDILAAKAFEQPSVTAIELNPLMRYVVQERYGDYSGRPYTLPGVEVIVDEARSRLSGIDRRFDVIQLSFIDTFALNAAGGFVFSENYLYTAEAFHEYFRHLTDDGILTVSRYMVADYPYETQRLAALVRTVWNAEGVGDVSRHVIVVRHRFNAVLLAKRSPFTGEEIATIERVAKENNIAVAYRPGARSWFDAGIGDLLETPDLAARLAAHPLVISPPSDDRPFFFHLLRRLLRPDELPTKEKDPFEFLRQWNEALALLYLLVAVVVALGVLFFLGPLLVLARRKESRVGVLTAAPLLLYFACLGYGFIMIEIPLLQRYVLLLGYPVYALAVVLFSLLLFSGLGSLMTSYVTGDPRRALLRLLPAIVVLGLVAIKIVPRLVDITLGAPIALRIAVTVLSLAPIGLLLGMAYPLGVGVLRRFDEQLVPWAWGLNGCLSVVASVLAIFLGTRYGFSFAFLSGVAAYALGLIVMVMVPWLPRSEAGA